MNDTNWEDIVFTLLCCPGGIIAVEDGAEIGTCKKCGSRVWVGDPPLSSRHGTAIVEGNVELGEGSFLGWYSIVRGNVRAGKNLRLGALASIEGDVTIGDDVTIRGKCEIPNSIIGNRVSIYSGTKFYDTPRLGGPNLPPTIEDDVTIGCDSAILGGVTVGARSIIGARCFVTQDIPPDSYVTAVTECRIRPRR